MIRSTRLRLTLLIAAPAALVAAVVMIGSLAWLSEPGAQNSLDTALARYGDIPTLVLVVDAATDSMRQAAWLWGLAIPAIALIVASVVAWNVAGRVEFQVDDARRLVKQADENRERRLEEIVHELRTPMAVMATNLELTGKTSGERNYLTAAQRAVDRMARTVDDLARHGELAIEQQEAPTDLASIVETTASEHVGPSRARDVHVLLAGTESIDITRIDPDAVATVLSNLLSNATRLAPPGSSVLIDWGRADNWAWLAVSDDGPGLAPHQHALAFERGWQGSHDRDRSRGGSAGLGLTIARQLAEAQGGAITLLAAEGAGATLALWLPLCLDADRTEILAADGVHPARTPWKRPQHAFDEAFKRGSLPSGPATRAPEVFLDPTRPASAEGSAGPNMA